jgi:hypothetical protein
MTSNWNKIVSLLPVLHCYKNGCSEKHLRLQSSGRLNLIPKLLCSVDSRGSQLGSEGKTRVMLVGRLEALQTSSTPWGYLPKKCRCGSAKPRHVPRNP